MTVVGSREHRLLVVRDLKVSYDTRKRRPTPPIVKGVSFEIDSSRTLGMVGESGSGKTTIGRALLGLASVVGGEVQFEGEDISSLPRAGRRRISKSMQVVFQDPYSSLNPSMRVGEILAEPLREHGVGRASARARIAELLDQVGLASDSSERYANEFSGGQRQRIAIARAIALDPKLIICDEPVSALDLSTQARILDLLLAIQQETGVAYLFISHDLDVVRHMADDIAVIEGGRFVELGSAAQVMGAPQSDYTKRLLAARPVIDPQRQADRRKARLELKRVAL